MSISGLGVLLLIAAVLIGIRVVLFKLFKPGTELLSFPIENLTSQDAETVSQTSSWPVVVLLCVVVVSIVALMMFGRALGG